jgi:phosphate transport system substrate-binding protein
MLKRKIAAAIVMLVAGLALISGCSRDSASGTSVQIKGSDTMVTLGQAWAQAFMERSPGYHVAVTGGGSGTGIAALINGSADIAQSSREMKPEEIEQAKQRGYNPTEFTVALDALTVVVSPRNPVSRLTIDQLSGIYSGRIRNWSQVGGRDMNIVVLSREKNSGTHVYFLEEVVRRGNAGGPEQFAPGVLMLPSSQTIADEIAGNPSAIGYFGLGWLDSRRHKAVAIAQTAAGPYVTPTPETATSGEYPISRRLYLYTREEPRGAVDAFVDFVLSDQGQSIVTQQEFIPIKGDS